MTSPPPRLAIVIGTFNRLDQLQACLETIQAETHTPHEVWVTDAGSDDGTIPFLETWAAAAANRHIILEGRRVGQARALNAVFQRVQAPHVCWLSDDNQVVDGGLDRAMAILDDEPSIGMVGLKVRDLRGPFATAPYIGGITITGVININQGVLRTPILQALGGFDEDFRDYGIDADLTTRVLLAGHAVALTRAVAIHHTRNWPEPGTPEAARHAERDKAYKTRYRDVFAPRMGRSPWWLARRVMWRGLRALFPRRLDLDNPNPVFGWLVRDWHNILAGRLVNPWREWTTPARHHHLVQRWRP